MPSEQRYRAEKSSDGFCVVDAAGGSEPVIADELRQEVANHIVAALNAGEVIDRAAVAIHRAIPLAREEYDYWLRLGSEQNSDEAYLTLRLLLDVIGEIEWLTKQAEDKSDAE